MSVSPLHAFIAASSLVVLLAACGDDSGGATSGAGGSTGAQTSAQGGATQQGSGGDDGSGGESSSSSSSSSPSSSSSQSGPSSSASSTSSGAGSTGSGCVPQCDGKECGDDACGGVCGACDGEMVCSSEGQCITVDPGSMSFFITSVGNLSGDFGGIDGADDYCQGLAEAAGSDRAWRAYVSTATEDARDRIGAGPWFDATGEMVADSVGVLHAAGLFYENALDEYGDPVPNGKTDPGENEHDVLTGSNQDGTYSGANCNDWTSSSPDGSATAGHCDASFTASGGSSPVEPSDNWNSTHDTSGCDQGGLNGTGSTARLYCFAE